MKDNPFIYIVDSLLETRKLLSFQQKLRQNMQNKEFFEVENLYQCIDQKGEGIHPEDLSNFLNKHGIIHEKQSLENFIHFYAFKEFKDVPELLEPDKLYEKKEKSNKETLIQSESEVLNSINFNLLISKNPSELFINSILNIN